MLKRALGVLVLVAIAAPSWAKSVDVIYKVKFLPEQNSARVTIKLEDGTAVPNLIFNFLSAQRYSDFTADGGWQLNDNRGEWQPAAGKNSLSYTVTITPENNKHASEKITKDWLVMKGDSLVPPIEAITMPKVSVVSRVQFELPKEWRSVETVWKRVGPNKFRIEDAQSGFNRPTGWIAAGKLGSRRAKLGETEVTIAAPVGQQVHRMDMMTLMTYVWPQLQAAFPRDPQKLLVVSARDGMQQQAQGLTQSIYLAADQALVAESGTSDLLKELVLSFTQLSSNADEQWISQGLAQFYSLELLMRSGGITPDRYQHSIQKWKEDTKQVNTLRGSLNEQKVERAALFFAELDKEIKARSKNEFNLDNVTRGLMRLDNITVKDVRDISENIVKGRLKIFESSLVK
ncbi:hypothetical protein VQ643_15755 [Pseudomonas sp. F1_0610]|uniref:hypothetical protein n=1 Tax=Pseudomonas sp. F1_0610 TaxID=3114284 RepID=UPI0039C09068